jgi:hypothetical protein
VVGMQGEDDVDRVLDVLARPERGERACWRVLACFGRARSGQCRGSALLGRVPSSSLSCVDAPGQGDASRWLPERGMPKLAGCALPWSFSLTFPLSLTLASTKLDAGSIEVANDHQRKLV